MQTWNSATTGYWRLKLNTRKQASSDQRGWVLVRPIHSLPTSVGRVAELQQTKTGIRSQNTPDREIFSLLHSVPTENSIAWRRTRWKFNGTVGGIRGKVCTVVKHTNKSCLLLNSMKSKQRALDPDGNTSLPNLVVRGNARRTYQLELARVKTANHFLPLPSFGIKPQNDFKTVFDWGKILTENINFKPDYGNWLDKTAEGFLSVLQNYNPLFGILLLSLGGLLSATAGRLKASIPNQFSFNALA